MELVDVTLRLAEPQFMELLTISVGYPTPEKLAAIGDSYAQEPSWNAYALLKNSVVVGVVGFQITSPGCGRIRNIAVLPKARGLGHGRRLIEGVRERATLNELYAETDADAVQFYKRRGFSVESLGERYPGVERFACRWCAG